MEAIRTIQVVKEGEVHVRLPRQFWGQKVEIIILPVSPQESQIHSSREKRLRRMSIPSRESCSERPRKRVMRRHHRGEI